MQGKLIENGAISLSFTTTNTSGAISNSAWINLKTDKRQAWQIIQGSWAGGTPAVTFNQATNSAGGNSKALAIDYYYQNNTTVDVPTVNAITSNTFNLPATANTVTVVEIHAQDLDATNSFAYVQCSVASPGGNTDYLTILTTSYEAHYPQLPSTRASVIS